MADADYIVVGAGSAGCIVATRLAERGAKVVLLEAGGTDRTRFCMIPGMISIVHTVPQVKKRFDWGYYTVPQKNAAERRIPTVRGRVLGGSSSINGMLFVRGNRANFDSWAAEGCKGWSYADVLPAFKRLEDWENGANELRGAGGPIAVTRQGDVTGASTEFMNIAAERWGIPVLDDYNGASQEGTFLFQMSAKKGLRYSTSQGFLLGRPNDHLTVRTGVVVSRVVIENGRATGVEILVNGAKEILRAGREVILSAGVIGSPQILMLSGVGPAAHLREHGISALADLPVGDNYHDHLFLPMTFLMRSAVHRGTPAHFLGGMAKEALTGNTWFGKTVFETGAFLRSKHAPDAVPDLQVHTLPWSYPSPNQDLPVRHTVDTRPALTVMPTLIYPKSRGTVRLSSADPTAPPLIDPNYLGDPADARFLIDGQLLVRDLMCGGAFGKSVTGELHPGDAAPGESGLVRELPNRIHTVYHPVGTCRMGTDERAVVDPMLRVRGIDALRVADASIMPTITGGNTNAPAMMIGERCAELMTATS